MTNKKKNWIWYIVIGIIILIILYKFRKWFETRSQFDSSDAMRKAQRISDLKKEKSILLSHVDKLNDLQDKINKQSENIWRTFVRLIIIGLILLNGIILGLFYLIAGEIIFSDVLTLYSILFFCFNIVFFFLTYNFFSIKKFVFEWLKEYSYKKVAGSRDAVYFEIKSETIQNRIEQIDLEIKQLEA